MFRKSFARAGAASFGPVSSSPLRLRAWEPARSAWFKRSRRISAEGRPRRSRPCSPRVFWASMKRESSASALFSSSAPLGAPRGRFPRFSNSDISLRCSLYALTLTLRIEFPSRTTRDKIVTGALSASKIRKPSLFYLGTTDQSERTLLEGFCKPNTRRIASLRNCNYGRSWPRCRLKYIF